MNKKRYIGVLFISLMGFGLIFNSCNFQTKKGDALSEYNTLVEISKRLLELHPDSSILYADSALIIAINAHLDDSTFVNVCEIKSEAFIDLNKLDSAIKSISYIDSIANITSDSVLIEKSMLLKAEVEYAKENFLVAEKYINTVVSSPKNVRNQDDLAKACNLLGKLLYEKGLYKDAQVYLLRAYSLFQDANNLFGMATASISIASNYSEIGSEKDALKYYHMAYQIAQEINSNSIEIASLINLGVFYRTSNVDSAKYYYGEALELIPASPITLSRIQTEYNLANIYMDNMETDAAMKIYQRIYAQSSALNLRTGVAIISSGLAGAYESQGQYDIAEKYLLDAIAYFKSEGMTKFEIAFKSQLKDLYRSTGRYDQALNIADELKEKTDSLRDIKKELAIYDLEFFYQSEKIRLENKNLVSEIANYRLNLMLRLIVILFLISIIVFILIIFRRRNKVKKQIIRDLEEKNKIETELKEVQAAQAEWLKRIVKQQQNEWMDLSRENEEIRRTISTVDIVACYDDAGNINNNSKKNVDQFHWKNMLLRFSVVYPEFIDNLNKRFPKLTNTEIQFCVLIKINIPLSNIASIFNVSLEVLNKRKRKLEEKLSICKEEDDLYETIQEIS